MTLKGWMVLSTVALTLSVTGLAFAQQPQAQPAPAQPHHTERGTGMSMSNPATTEGKPITAYGQPTVERWVGMGMSNPATTEGKPITTTTSFGQR
jgi:hypothetical protein